MSCAFCPATAVTFLSPAGVHSVAVTTCSAHAVRPARRVPRCSEPAPRVGRRWLPGSEGADRRSSAAAGDHTPQSSAGLGSSRRLQPDRREAPGSAGPWPARREGQPSAPRRLKGKPQTLELPPASGTPCQNEPQRSEEGGVMQTPTVLTA